MTTKLGVANNKRKAEASKIRAPDGPDIAVWEQIVGRVAFCGVQKNPPKVKSFTNGNKRRHMIVSKLDNLDIVRIVTASNEDVDIRVARAQMLDLPPDQRVLVPSFVNPTHIEPYDKKRKCHPKRNNSGIDVTHHDCGFDSKVTARVLFKQLPGYSRTVARARNVRYSPPPNVPVPQAPASVAQDSESVVVLSPSEVPPVAAAPRPMNPPPPVATVAIPSVPVADASPNVAAMPSPIVAPPSVASVAPSLSTLFEAESFDFEGERMEITGGDFSRNRGHSKVTCRRKKRTSANAANETRISLDFATVSERVRARQNQQRENERQQNPTQN